MDLVSYFMWKHTARLAGAEKLLTPEQVHSSEPQMPLLPIASPTLRSRGLAVQHHSSILPARVCEPCLTASLLPHAMFFQVPFVCLVIFYKWLNFIFGSSKQHGKKNECRVIRQSVSSHRFGLCTTRCFCVANITCIKHGVEGVPWWPSG